MKLLLDEIWTPTIALELRRRDFDVVAASEPAHVSRYAGIPDDALFARAQDDGRTIVTDNLSNYDRPPRAEGRQRAGPRFVHPCRTRRGT